VERSGGEGGRGVAHALPPTPSSCISYRTALCNDGPACARRTCFFAHDPARVRVPPVKPFVPPDALAAAQHEAARRIAAAAGGSAGGSGGAYGPPAPTSAPPPALPSPSSPRQHIDLRTSSDPVRAWPPRGGGPCARAAAGGGSGQPAPRSADAALRALLRSQLAAGYDAEAADARAQAARAVGGGEGDWWGSAPGAHPHAQASSLHGHPSVLPLAPESAPAAPAPWQRTAGAWCAPTPPPPPPPPPPHPPPGAPPGRPHPWHPRPSSLDSLGSRGGGAPLSGTTSFDYSRDSLDSMVAGRLSLEALSLGEGSASARSSLAAAAAAAAGLPPVAPPRRTGIDAGRRELEKAVAAAFGGEVDPVVAEPSPSRAGDSPSSWPPVDLAAVYGSSLFAAAAPPPSPAKAAEWPAAWGGLPPRPPSAPAAGRRE